MADAASVLTALATLYVQERRLTDASQTLARVLVILQRSKDTVPVDHVKLQSVRSALHFLYWDRDGFAVWSKRLEEGTYVGWPYPGSDYS